MKHTILFIFLCALLFTGCRTSKNITSQTTESVRNSEKQNEVTSSETYNFADVTKKSDIGINYFKVEFYPPVGPDDNPDTIPDNYILLEALQNNAGSMNPKKPPGKGAIKSIESYTVESKSDESGINESRENLSVNRNEETSVDISKQERINEQPAPDPYRWRYILAIIVIVLAAGTAVYFWLRKTKVVTTIVSTIISFIRNFFVHK